MNDLASSRPSSGVTVADLLQGTLIDSRQRWRDLVNLIADFAFETDEWGRFVLISPDPALAWPANSLIGQTGTALLTETEGAAAFNPFRVTAEVRHRQAWLKRGDGGAVCLTFCATPILDALGAVRGVRGVGIDMTENDSQTAQITAALRRAEVLDHILWHMGQEVLAPRMMTATLEALASALGAEGMAVVLLPPKGPTQGNAPLPGKTSPKKPPAGAPAPIAAAPITHAPIAHAPIAPGPLTVAHGVGEGVEWITDTAVHALSSPDVHPARAVTAEGRPVLVSPCQTRFGEQGGIVAWREPNGRAWDADDDLLLASANGIIRMVLEHDSTQREMTVQARTDPLTGLLNRRAFLEEIERHAARLDKEHAPGTLLFADLDHFKPVNDRLGHEAGDQVLIAVAALLRETVRPSDLVARLGGDEFAIWMNGADHMTAAERAEALRDSVPRALSEITGPDGPRLSLSIGSASRVAGDDEPLDSLMRRADMAMYEVKRGGRGHWRVAPRKRG